MGEAIMKRAIGLVLGSAAFLWGLPLCGFFAHAADAQGKWSVAAQMTTTRTQILADAYTGKIYVAGGAPLGRPGSTPLPGIPPQTGDRDGRAPPPIRRPPRGLAPRDTPDS